MCGCSSVSSGAPAAMSSPNVQPFWVGRNVGPLKDPCDPAVHRMLICGCAHPRPHYFPCIRFVKLMHLLHILGPNYNAVWGSVMNTHPQNWWHVTPWLLECPDMAAVLGLEVYGPAAPEIVPEAGLGLLGNPDHMPTTNELICS